MAASALGRKWTGARSSAKRSSAPRQSPTPPLGPAVELLGRGAAILGERRRIQRRDRGVAPRRVDQEVVPERARVAERAVEVDGDRAQRHIADRDGDADGGAGGVDEPVDGRAVPPRDEGLVELVRDGVGGGDEKRRGRVANGAVEKRAEQRVLRRVRDLPQDEVPRAEAGAEIRHGREREDDCGPENDRDPRADAGCGHAQSVVPRRGDGPKCRSSRSIWQVLPPASWHSRPTTRSGTSRSAS